MDTTPREDGLRQPAEWDRHDAVWLAWPSHAELWQDALPDAQAELVGLCDAIADGGRGETLCIVVRSERDETIARAALAGRSATFHRAAYGDIWLRDTAPVFLVGSGDAVASVRFRFNGWGGKYVLPGDAELAASIQDMLALPKYELPFVLEGGAIDVDGEGTVLTTRQCLLNPNRNPGMGQAAIEKGLADALGVSRVLWLDEGLLHDHTDGHVDTIARFVAPATVVCMAPSGGDDPNARVLDRIAKDLEAMTDARGRKLAVHRIPSPGRVLDGGGEVMPASYANFYIGNSAVVVPTYDTPWDDAVVRALAPLFPGRRIIARPSKTILEGGGAFHCITQQMPAAGGTR
jgi:agmatine deiminase